MILQKLEKEDLIRPPSWLPYNTQYLAITGSHAYGVADTTSKDIPDYDHIGFCIPPKSEIFPNEIPGFGKTIKPFEQWEESHIYDKAKKVEYDFKIYSIVKFLELCRQNNPNILDSLFIPMNYITHCTSIGHMVHEKRKTFLSKISWKKYRDYAHSQLHKIETKDHQKRATELRKFETDHNIDTSTKLIEVEREFARRAKDNLCDLTTEALSLFHQHPVEPLINEDKLTHLSDRDLSQYYLKYKTEYLKSTRFEMVKLKGYDVKFAYNLIRLLDEAEQILLTGDINLQQAREAMKSVRRGEWSLEEIRSWMMEKDKSLEAAYASCKLPDVPDEAKMRTLLVECLEEHYGSLSALIGQPDWAVSALREFETLAMKYRPKLAGMQIKPWYKFW